MARKLPSSARVARAPLPDIRVAENTPWNDIAHTVDNYDDLLRKEAMQKAQPFGTHLLPQEAEALARIRYGRLIDKLQRFGAGLNPLDRMLNIAGFMLPAASFQQGQAAARRRLRQRLPKQIRNAPEREES